MLGIYINLGQLTSKLYMLVSCWCLGCATINVFQRKKVQKVYFIPTFCTQNSKTVLQRFYKKICRNGCYYCYKLPFANNGGKTEDIGNHSIRLKMCLNTCLISFLGKLLRAFDKSYNALSFESYTSRSNTNFHATNCMPPKRMYIAHHKSINSKEFPIRLPEFWQQSYLINTTGIQITYP